MNNRLLLKKMSFKIYTKTGDKGTSSVLGGKRFSKDSQIFNVLGTIDELNSYLGVSNTYLKKEGNNELSLNIELIQNQLIKVGSHIASNGNKKYDFKFDEYVENMETKIDEYETQLTPLKQFILPGGSESSSFLHLSRTVCRRVEREINSLFDDNTNPHQFGKSIDDKTLVYFNRLSDLLFVSARKANSYSKIEDVICNSNI